MSSIITAEKNLAKSISKDLKLFSKKINSYDIHYVKIGKSKKNLILLHGANFGWGQWYPNIKELSKNFTVYAIDMPNSGFSTKKKNFSVYKLWPEILKKFIKINNIRKISLLGHSTGAWSAAKYASENKVQKLVLISPLGLSKYTHPKFRLLKFSLFRNFLSKKIIKKTKNGWKNFLEESLEHETNVSEYFVNYLLSASMQKNWIYPFEVLSQTVNLSGIKDKFVFDDDILNKIVTDTLVIFGRKDKSFSESEIKNKTKRIKNSKLVVYKESGHVINIEESARLNKEIIRFSNV